MATQPNTHLKTLVGRNVVAGRDRKNMTQHQLASILMTSVSRVSGWETGKHLPRNPQALADALFDGDITQLYREAERESVAA